MQSNTEVSNCQNIVNTFASPGKQVSAVSCFRPFFFFEIPSMSMFPPQEPTVWPTREISCVQSLGTRIAQCLQVTPCSTSTRGSSSPANR